MSGIYRTTQCFTLTSPKKYVLYSMVQRSSMMSHLTADFNWSWFVGNVNPFAHAIPTTSTRCTRWHRGNIFTSWCDSWRRTVSSFTLAGGPSNRRRFVAKCTSPFRFEGFTNVYQLRVATNNTWQPNPIPWSCQQNRKPFLHGRLPCVKSNCH